VRDNSKVPVIETGAGIVHTYFDESGDLEKGAEIIENAKTRRVSVCNSLDCLIIHSARIKDLSQLTHILREKQVEIFADEAAYAALNGNYPDQLLHKAQPQHFGTEFLSMKMAIKTVDNFKQALEHIAINGSKHSEAIISENADNIATFLNDVDAAAVYANVSTAFTDGAQFGLGAEIGISTQKLHARGPMGLEELTSYKWIVKGNGQTRTP
jgi:glutamate-5-semialdehyde dehydrogenase